MKETTMKTIQVLGTGCAKCTRLAANAERAVRESGIEGQVVKVREIAEMLAFEAVSALPALAVDGRVRSCGRVLSVRQIREILRSAPPSEPKTTCGSSIDDLQKKNYE